MKQITVAVVLDDDEGMMFFGKRQSRDRVLIEELISSSENTPIYIHPYSKLLFPDLSRVTVSDDPLHDCPDGGTVFVEHLPLTPHLGDIGKMIVYRWNRLYPSDKKFDIDLARCGFTRLSLSEFPGSSHDKITKEVYRKDTNTK